MDHRPKSRILAIKFLQENTDENLSDLGHHKYFSDRTQKASTIKKSNQTI